MKIYVQLIASRLSSSLRQFHRGAWAATFHCGRAVKARQTGAFLIDLARLDCDNGEESKRKFFGSPSLRSGLLRMIALWLFNPSMLDH
jgi:hypothetical protein